MDPVLNGSYIHYGMGLPTSAYTTGTLSSQAYNSNSSEHSADPSSSGSPSSGPNMNLLLTIRLLMQGKEVGSIIGKRGDQIKRIREESGAKINISDGSCPERIVTITGSLTTINKAFTMISNKFEEGPCFPRIYDILRLSTADILQQKKLLEFFNKCRGKFAAQTTETDQRHSSVDLLDNDNQQRLMYDHLKLQRDASDPDHVLFIANYNAPSFQDMRALPNSVPKPPITMRLIVPATQCGSLIGKSGSKIKEIREVLRYRGLSSSS
ncbi:KH domain protein [Dictyocaulus viviparus]|uniref:KH domain protein n=1 Tax=Dictyocaulus viviparus TaxID=29172 RepID=A0A0D8Y7S0_DICVI|nr:KH domain protein [Dictyocaulus viviparus]